MNDSYGPTGRRYDAARSYHTSTSAAVPAVVAFVDAHYTEPISLRDVARALAYSPAHLTDRFRRATGIGVTGWIIRRRVAAACRLFDDHDLPVSVVCERVGFNDVSYFTKQFTRVVGTTPGRYRADARRRNAA